DASAQALVDTEDGASRLRQGRMTATHADAGIALATNTGSVRAVPANTRATGPGIRGLRVDAPDARSVRAALANDRAVCSSGLAPRKHSCCNAKRDRATSCDRLPTRGNYPGLFFGSVVPTCFAIHSRSPSENSFARSRASYPGKCLPARRAAR